MWTELKPRWLCACLIMFSLPGAVFSAAPEELTALLADRRCDNYVAATSSRLLGAEAAFASLLQGHAGPPAGITAAWAALGFSVRQVDVAGVHWQVLREAGDSCTGQGLYLVRAGDTAGLVVQVPHGYHDVHTDDIALGLVHAPVRIIAFNTVPRSFERQGKQVDADLAHRADSLFTALTRALARTLPDGRLVQLHGFSSGKRRTVAAAGAAAIISAGRSRATAGIEDIAGCLRPLLDGPVLRYPEEVRELGGTRNSQGQLLQRFHHDGFVHLELNRATRDRLRNEEALRTAFAHCLSSGMGSP